jgi:hypothetical protein
MGSGFRAYSVGVYHYFPSYPLDAMNIKILGRRGVFSRQVPGSTEVSLKVYLSF